MRRCCPIATIVELVTKIIEPAIQAPFELVDVEYEKVVGDYVLSIFVDKPGGITLKAVRLINCISIFQILGRRNVMKNVV